MVSRMRSSDLRCQADQPVPRHARGRTGRRRQHARCLSPRPRRISPHFSPAPGRASPTPNPDAAGLPRRSRHARLQIIERRAAAVGDAASVSLPAERADPQRRSRGDPVRSEARTRPAEGAVDRRCRSPADARARNCTQAPDASPLQRLRALRLYCLLEVLYATACACPNWCRCRCRRRGATPA